jgi:hypothetical protein
MSTQIFKKEIPSNLLFDLLDKICMKNEKHYLLNIESFKKGTYNNCIQEFLESCKPYYHNSKKIYLEKQLSYNSFVTVVRQICNYNKLTYASQIKYSKSNYDIIYIIYLKT